MRSTFTPWSDVVLCKSFDVVSCPAGGKANGVGVRRRAERRAATVAVCRRVGRLARAYARVRVKNEDSMYQYGVHSFMYHSSHSLHTFSTRIFAGRLTHTPPTQTDFVCVHRKRDRSARSSASNSMRRSATRCPPSRCCKAWIAHSQTNYRKQQTAPKLLYYVRSRAAREGGGGKHGVRALRVRCTAS